MDKPAKNINSINELIGCQSVKVVCNKFLFEGGKGEETVIAYCTRPIIV